MRSHRLLLTLAWSATILSLIGFVVGWFSHEESIRACTSFLVGVASFTLAIVVRRARLAPGTRTDWPLTKGAHGSGKATRHELGFDPQQGYPAGASLFYECRRCGDVLPSSLARSRHCMCNNIRIDADAGRIVIEEPLQAKLFSLSN